MISSVWLATAFVVLAAISYWAGFRAKPHPLQYKSQAGFFIFILLAIFAGYFTVREFSAIDELSVIIDPVPGITEVIYIPSNSEASAVTSLLSTVTPPHNKDAQLQLEELIHERQSEYWSVTTSLPASSVLKFYRDNARKKGWTINNDRLPWLIFSRGPEKLSIYISGTDSGIGSRLLYSVELSKPR